MDDQQLEAVIEDLTIKLAEREKESLWHHFLPQHLKLHLAKQIINYTTPKLNKLIPDREPTYSITKVVDRVLKAFLAMARDQQKRKMLKDQNFINLIETVRRSLIFISEEDIYYRGWLHVLFLVLYLEVKENLPDLAVTEKIAVKVRDKVNRITITENKSDKT